MFCAIFNFQTRSNTLFYEYLNIFLLTGLSFFCNDGQDESEQDSY